jgi:predicted nuclease with TOPRIM domain
MISLEQVQLLETKVAKAIEYVQRVNSENAALLSERTGLQTKLDANQKRLDELELLVIRFKEEQGRIEGGIVAALDRLSQFEEAFEKSLKEKTPTAKKNQSKKEKSPEPESNASESNSKEFFEISAKEAKKNAEISAAMKNTKDGTLKDDGDPQDSDSQDDGDSLESVSLDSEMLDSDSQDKELDIF